MFSLSVWGFLLLMQTTQSSPLTEGLLSDEGWLCHPGENLGSCVERREKPKLVAGYFCAVSAID
jgi:hypothetical protein